MGERAGHGESCSDHRPSRDDLGGAGVRLAEALRRPYLERKRINSRGALFHRAFAVTIQMAAGRNTLWSRTYGWSASRIEFVAAVTTAGDCSASARAAGPISSVPWTAASRPPRIATSSDRSHGSMATFLNPASLKMRRTRCGEANENGPGSSGPDCGSLGACL